MAIGASMSIPTYAEEMIPSAAGDFPATFITFNYADERPTLRGSGTDIAEEATVQVHLFTEGDPTTLKETLKQKLRAAGFTILNTAQFYEDDTDQSHIVVSVWDWDTITEVNNNG